MAKNTILWLSRHSMTDEQKAHWLELFQDAEFITENITWQGTDDADADLAANQETWSRLVGRYHPAVIAGVFPAVAREAVNHSVPMHEAISRQNAVERQDGTKQIVFQHIRWSRNVNPNK